MRIKLYPLEAFSTYKTKLRTRAVIFCCSWPFCALRFSFGCCCCCCLLTFLFALHFSKQEFLAHTFFVAVLRDAFAALLVCRFFCTRFVLYFAIFFMCAECSYVNTQLLYAFIAGVFSRTCILFLSMAVKESARARLLDSFFYVLLILLNILHFFTFLSP